MRRAVIVMVVWAALVVVGVAGQEADLGYTPRYEETSCLFELPEPDIICGTVTVPENRADPTGRQVRLAVTVIPALTDPLPDPIIYLSGGPGGRASFLLYRWLNHPMRVNRDVILLDQRGTGFSTPSLNCPEIEENRNGPYVLPVEYCRYRTVEEEGTDINQYHSAASAADIRDLVRVMGYEQVNLYGISYGSRLALTVLREYPEIVRAAVLDAVFPPEADLISERIRTRFRAFEALFGACNANPACRAAYPDLEARFYEVVERYNNAPYTFDTTFPGIPPTLTGDLIVDALFLGLYNTPSLGMIPEGIARLERAESEDDIAFGYYMTRGRVTPEVYRSRQPVSEPSIEDSPEVQAYEDRVGEVDYAEGMHLSVNCAEELPFSDGEAATQADAEIVPQILLRYLSADVSALLVSCNMWNVQSLDPVETERVQSDVPVLLISGVYDPITAVGWAISARVGLPNSRLVVFGYGGHGVSVDDPCGRALVTAHFNAPTLTPDSSCADGDIDFFTGD